MDLIALGFWKSGSSSEFPDPFSLVDPAWSESERQVLSDYLLQGHVARQFMGASRCRFCDQLNGSTELTDGKYIWPSGLAHYVAVHSVRLPAEFVSYVFARLDELEAATVDLSWWKHQSY